MKQFTVQINTYDKGAGWVARAVNNVLKDGDCRLVAIHSVKIAKIGGTDTELLAVFEEAKEDK
jgi:hypothetical protein